ncbi:phenylethanolamine N-methyltransferase [Bombina bombina]|uniref:phenylethanolamine N-methyltransferase n=1 Tax=Bombina bombina TaxID=8345 RepID=UPI00235B2394|nr:phenylethanolamine N-methyltransferase [Bombina bombina]XP_053549947.1 phenylethanolamine N-methyltransferase [Bombina bombina]
MNSIQSIADNYQKFNPRAYLQNNYVPPRADFSCEDSVVPWKLRCLAEACSKGEIRGRTLVDIGSGPTIYQLLSAFELFQEVVMTDYLEVNREEVKRWIDDEPGAFDWSPYIKHVCSLESKGELWQEKQNRLRKRITRVVPVDIHQPCPLGKEFTSGSVDALVSSFCLEACSPNRESFEQALKNITGLLRAGGHLLLIGALEESYYLAGEARLSVVPVTEEDVRTALCNAGYRIRDFRTYSMPPSMKVGVDDVSGIFFAWAQKMP